MESLLSILLMAFGIYSSAAELVGTEAIGGFKVEIIPSTDQIKPIGSSLILTCILSHTGSVQDSSIRQVFSANNERRVLAWSAPDGSQISQDRGRRYVEWLDDSRSRLYIASLSKEDEGKFICSWKSPNSPAQGISTRISVSLFETIRFEDSPEAFNATYGDTVLLKCSATGNPAPEMSWRFKGSKISQNTDRLEFGLRQKKRQTSSESRRIVKKEGLEIMHVGPQDSGVYQCRALVSSQGNLKVRQIYLNVDYPPVSLGPLVADAAVSGNDFSITCRSIGQPMIQFEWLKDGMVLNPQKLLIDENDLEVDLQQQNVNHFGDNNTHPSDPGAYLQSIDSVTNIRPQQFLEYNNKSSRGSIGVEMPELNPNDNIDSNVLKLQREVHDMISKHGSSRVQISRLIVRGSNSDRDNGRYTCRASNMLGKHDVSININVQVVPKLGSIFNTSLLRAVEGRNIELHCEILSGFPTPNLYWIGPDGQEVRGNVQDLYNEQEQGISELMNDRFVLTESNEESRLIFKNINRAEAGDYTCVAKNSIGSDKITFSLLVEHKPEMIWHGASKILSTNDVKSDDVRSDVASTTYGDAAIPLKIDSSHISGFGSSSVSEVVEVVGWEGQTRIFRCEVLGQPPPDFTWRHYHHHIDQQDNNYNNNNAADDVGDDDDNDVNDYQQNLNDDDRIEDSIKNVIKSGIVGSIKQKETNLPETYEILTERVGKKTVSILKIFIRSSAGNTLRKAEQNFQEEEEVYGEYSCMAKNVHGVQKAAFLLSQAYPPSAPRNITTDDLTATSVTLSFDFRVQNSSIHSEKVMLEGISQDKMTKNSHGKGHRKVIRSGYPSVEQWNVEAHNVDTGEMSKRSFAHVQATSDGVMNNQGIQVEKNKVSVTLDGLEPDSSYIFHVYGENVVGHGSVAKFQLKTSAEIHAYPDAYDDDLNIQSDAAIDSNDMERIVINVAKHNTLSVGVQEEVPLWKHNSVIIGALAVAGLVLLLIGSAVGAVIRSSRTAASKQFVAPPSTLQNPPPAEGCNRNASIAPSYTGSTATLLIRDDGKDIDNLKIDIGRVGGVGPLPEQLYRSLGRKPKLQAAVLSTPPMGHKGNCYGSLERGKTMKDGLIVHVGSEAQRVAWNQMLLKIKSKDEGENLECKSGGEKMVDDTGVCSGWGIIQREHDTIIDDTIRESGEFDNFIVNDDVISLNNEPEVTPRFEGKSFLSRS